MPGFYDLNEDQRVVLTERAMAEGRTLHERWNALTTAEAEPWSARAAIAAKFLSGETSVADFGCGTMTLERLLAPGSAYYPVDMTRRDDRTIVCDLNGGHIPETPARAAACLGLLEYLIDPDALLAALNRSYDVCVMSYCITDAPQPPANRRSHAWVNDFDRAAIERAFDRTGWQVAESQPVDQIQHIWRLRRR